MKKLEGVDPDMERAGLAPGEVAPGVFLLGRYGPYRCGAWMLAAGGECALFEQPFEREFSKAARDAARLARKNGWTARYVLSSHSHLDHTGALGFYRIAFPGARFLAHASFREWFYPWAYDEYFATESLELTIGGEPLLLLHAPKHSPDDTLLFFRGTCLSGDWAWGAWPDCNPLVGTESKIRSLRAVARFLGERHYRVHTVLSSHANEARRDLGFDALLGETLRYWEEERAGREDERRRRLRKGTRRRS